MSAIDFFFSHYLKPKLLGERKEHFLLYISSSTCKIRERTQAQVVYLEGGPRMRERRVGVRDERDPHNG